MALLRDARPNRQNTHTHTYTHKSSLTATSDPLLLLAVSAAEGCCECGRLATRRAAKGAGSRGEVCRGSRMVRRVVRGALTRWRAFVLQTSQLRVAHRFSVSQITGWRSKLAQPNADRTASIVRRARSAQAETPKRPSGKRPDLFGARHGKGPLSLTTFDKSNFRLGDFLSLRSHPKMHFTQR